MRKIIATLVCLLIACTASWAQYTIKGTVTDTLNFRALPSASVVIIRKSDSVIQKFTRTAHDGRFEMRLAAPGKYILRTTFPGFVDYVDVITIDKPMYDMGIVPMISKERLLKEFVLTRQLAAIKIKGDTTEYVADSFATKENATVEDLLKKLPGIQVDKDGKITAQGATVQKILVDGEEFFSDDPKVVTKGLQANAVEKVQVFDKKSDQAEFTGIDDGEKTKTINLELKEDKKKGFFGKVDAGGGTDGYFQNQAMINAFKAKRQFSAFGIMSNTDKAGLGWEDNGKFGSGNGNTEISDEGDIRTTWSRDEDDLTGWDGSYNGEGLPKTWTGGLHYADKWNKDVNHISGNYRYAKQNVEIDGNTVSQYVLPGNAGFTQQSDKKQFSKVDRHGIDAVYDVKIDSSTTLKISAYGGTKAMQTFSSYFTESKGSEGSLINNNKRDITSDASSDYLNSSILLRKKFAKKGRSFSLDIRENYKNNSSLGFLNSTSVTLDTGSNLDTSLINQKKDNSSGSLSLSGKATYTEPLSKVTFLEINYSLNTNNSDAVNTSYNSNALGNYDMLDSVFSSNFKYDILTNRGGLNFKYVHKKVNLTVGGDVSETRYQQQDLLKGTGSLSRSFFNLFPSASLNYKFGKQTSLRFNYSGNTQQPTIDQVQPLLQNTDVLNQRLGNPDLRQSFTNRFSLNFNDYKVLTSRYTWASASFSTVSDAISTSQTTTSAGNTVQYVNVDGNYNGSLYFGGGIKLKKPEIYVGGQASATVYRTNNFVNGVANISDNNSYSINPYINYEKEDVFEINWSPEFTYNDNKAKISTFANSYWIISNDVSFSVQLGKKTEIGSSVSMMIRQRTEVFDQNNNVNKWNAYAERKFLKKNNLVLRVSVFDILNQNLGYSRTAYSGVITENRYNTIRRYGLVNLIWNFTHTPAGAPATEGPVMMIR